MCRSIKTLRKIDQPVTEAEIEAAALQFVRKVSGYRAPSQANRAAFDRAVAEVAAATRELLDGLVVGKQTGQVSKDLSGLPCSQTPPQSSPPSLPL